MAFNFQKFTDTRTSFSARVTLRQGTGQMGFSSGAINRFAIANYKYGVLYYDEAARAVGIQLLPESDEGAIPLKLSQTNSYLPAKNFCDLHAIDYRESHRFELQKDEETGLLYFLLDKEIRPKSSTRSSAEQKKEEEGNMSSE